MITNRGGGVGRSVEQIAQFGRIESQLVRVLLGAEGWHSEPMRHARQAHGIAQHMGPFVDDRHQAGLVVDQHQLGFGSIQQHRVFLSA